MFSPKVTLSCVRICHLVSLLLTVANARCYGAGFTSGLLCNCASVFYSSGLVQWLIKCASILIPSD